MKNLIMLSFILLTACGSKPPQDSSPDNTLEKTGEITDLHTGKSLTSRQLLVALSKQPRVIIGEKHDNAVHHRIELWLLQQLSQQRPQGSLLLEMITPDQQSRVDWIKKSLSERLPVDSLRLKNQINWSKGWDWALYGPIVGTAMQASYPLLSANLNRDEVLAFYAHPVLTTGPLSSQAEVRQSLSDIILLSHRSNLESQQLLAMLAIQQQRDRRMAQSLLAAPKPSLLIAGAYHAAKNLGIPLHVQDISSGELPTVLMLVAEGTAIDSSVADYQWRTPD